MAEAKVRNIIGSLKETHEIKKSMLFPRNKGLPYAFLPMKLFKNHFRDVLISAPHTIPQIRDGKDKVAEPETAVLACLINSELGCPVIYSVPNERGFCLDEYLSAIADYHCRYDVHFLVDLHQMDPQREELIDIGVGEDGKNLLDRKSCIESVLAVFSSVFGEGFVFKNKNFAANRSYTVSRRVAGEYNIPSIQIEINSRLLMGKVKDYNNVLFALMKTVEILHGTSIDYEFPSIRPQRIENIADGKLVVAPFDASGRRFDESAQVRMFRVINDITEDSLIVKKSHILVDPQLPNGAIRVDARYRIYLGIDMPSFIPKSVWSDIIHNGSKSECRLLRKCYPSQDHVLSYVIDQNDRESLRKLVSKWVTPKICFQSVRAQPRFSMYSKGGALADFVACAVSKAKVVVRRISDVFIGRSSVILMCRRPYKSDEGADIVRISKASMHLLGIQDMDMVTIRYTTNTVTCPVLAIDDELSFMRENKPSEINLSIGVPVHIRSQLGIQDVQSSVYVERDTVFLLKKNMSNQTVPFLLTIFVGLFAIGSLSRWVALAWFIFVVAPLVIYINLSRVRSMRGKVK